MTRSQVGFHAPAEHTLGAHRPALEVQLRHTKAGTPRRVHVPPREAGFLPEAASNDAPLNGALYIMVHHLMVRHYMIHHYI